MQVTIGTIYDAWQNDEMSAEELAKECGVKEAVILGWLSKAIRDSNSHDELVTVADPVEVNTESADGGSAKLDKDVQIDRTVSNTSSTSTSTGNSTANNPTIMATSNSNTAEQANDDALFTSDFIDGCAIDSDLRHALDTIIREDGQANDDAILGAALDRVLWGW